MQNFELDLNLMHGLLKQARLVLAAADGDFFNTGVDLDRLVCEMNLLRQSGCNSCPVMSWASVCSGSSGVCAANRILSQHASCVTAYTDLVLESIERLRPYSMSSPCPVSSLQEAEMIWETITSAGMLHSQWPLDWPDCGLSLAAALYAALHGLVSWLLPFTHLTKPTWACLPSIYKSTPVLHRLVMDTCTTAMAVTQRFWKLNGDELQEAMQPLPPDFLNKLCLLAIQCLGPHVRTYAIATEHDRLLTSSPDETARDKYTETFEFLVRIVHHCLKDLDSTRRCVKCWDPWAEVYLTPAVLEASKLMLLASRMWKHDSSRCHWTCAVTMIGRFLEVEITTLMQKNQGDLSSGLEQSKERIKSSDTAAEFQCTPLTTTSNILVMDTLLQQPLDLQNTYALRVASLLLRSVRVHEAANQPSHLPCLLKALLGSSGVAKIWLSSIPEIKLSCGVKAALLSEQRSAIELDAPLDNDVLLMGEGMIRARELMDMVFDTVPLILQQISLPSMDRTCVLMREWFSMSGSATTWETFLRNEHRPTGIVLVPLTVVATLNYIWAAQTFSAPVIEGGPHTQVSPALISLVATIRKLLDSNLFRDPALKKLGGPQQFFAGLGQCTELLCFIIKDLPVTHNWVKKISRKGGKPGYIHGVTHGGFSSPISNGFSDSKRSLGQPPPITIATSVGSVSDQATSSGEFAEAESVGQAVPGKVCNNEMLRLKAILAMALTQAVRFRKQMATELKMPVTVRPQLDKETKELAHIKAELMPSASTKHRNERMKEGKDQMYGRGYVSRMSNPHEWEEYAREHFHGRLLPGCCNFNCCNMSGISEAALHTMLCAGCRRMRYCSVACQKIAWHNGHRALCGKGDWMPTEAN